MNFIVSLLLNLYKKSVYNVILIIMNKYIKMTKYIFTFMKIKVIKLINLLYKEIYLKYNAF